MSSERRRRKSDFKDERAEKKTDGFGSEISLLWDVVVKNDDVSFKHILPKLNSNDVKFLYEVNGETRKLMKRSSRESDLKKSLNGQRYVVDIDVEWAWEHKSFWSGDLGPRDLSAGKLLTRINSSCSSGYERRKSVNGIIGRLEAAYQGNLEMVKYCVANECPIDINRNACACAALKGQLECLKYLHEEVKAPWDSLTARWAALNGHLHILEYLVERKFDKYTYLSVSLRPRKVT